MSIEVIGPLLASSIWCAEFLRSSLDIGRNLSPVIEGEIEREVDMFRQSPAPDRTYSRTRNPEALRHNSWDEKDSMDEEGEEEKSLFNKNGCHEKGEEEEEEEEHWNSHEIDQSKRA